MIHSLPLPQNEKCFWYTGTLVHYVLLCRGYCRDSWTCPQMMSGRYWGRSVSEVIKGPVPADHYRAGTGEAITVDASKIDLSFVDASELVVGKAVPVSTWKGKISQAMIYGSFIIQYLGNNNVIIKDDIYDSDMHAFSNFKETFRNVETIFASGLHGYGKPVVIHFKGVNKLK